jgi:hypothetical protein
MKLWMVRRLPTPLETIINKEGKAKCLKVEVNMDKDSKAKASTDKNHSGVIRDNKVTPLLPKSSIKSWATVNATKISIVLSTNSVSWSVSSTPK